MSSPDPTTSGHDDLPAILREALAQLGIGTYRFLLDGTIVYLDEILLGVLELDDRMTPADVVGKRIGDLYEYVEAPGSFRQEVLAKGKVLNRVYAYRTLSGHDRWVANNAYVVHDPLHDQAAIQVITMDITEERRREAQRAALEARMQQTQKLESLGVLAGGIAHDFNNLLTGILGNAGLCKELVPGHSAAHDRLERIEHAAREAAQLTRGMLAYAGRGRFQLGPVELSALAEDCRPLMHAAVAPRGELDVAVQPGLPPVTADATQLRQVLMNLVTNAADALDGEGGRVAIRTRLEECTLEQLHNGHFELDDPRPGPHVCLEVEDTGRGMDAETQARIFEPFFSTKFTGRGLGLAAVLGIVRSHHGSLAVRSDPGVGTCVRVWLPVAVEE